MRPRKAACVKKHPSAQGCGSTRAEVLRVIISALFDGKKVLNVLSSLELIFETTVEEAQVQIRIGQNDRRMILNARNFAQNGRYEFLVSLQPSLKVQLTC